MKGLYEHICGNSMLCYSKEVADEVEEGQGIEFKGETYLNLLLNFFLKDPVKKEVAELYARQQCLEGTAMLLAHGGSQNGEWVYSADNKSFKVQDWINELDGKYAVLCLNCCNPGHHEIYSGKSAVLAANHEFSWVGLDVGEVQLELYIPKIGYLDSYIIENELEKMRKKDNS